MEILADIKPLEWILIVDGLFLLWAFFPKKKPDYGRSTRASLRNGLRGPLWRD
ncbi:MAG: hypothetical protein AAF490_14680 [Chloroflexota bacterium]